MSATPKVTKQSHTRQHVLDLIEPEDVVVTLSHAGYAKRQPVSIYRAQRRGGKGRSATAMKEEDFVERLWVANTHDTLLAFTSSGRVLWLKVYKIPDASPGARGKPIVVIVGEEVKTAQGEVIGLYLRERIAPGMSMGDTIAAIQEQGGLVYMPHPFDRLHTIPDAPTLLRNLDQIDILEVYNSRLLFDSFNDDALRFASKYNLIQAAGSDAHVLPGIGTAFNRMPAFEGPEEFLLAMRQNEILRRPKSLLYLQGLKWVQSVAR